MKTAIVVLLITLALVFASGMVLAGSELANPWRAQEQAALVKAQREALEAENQVKLKAMEQEQAIRQEALKAQQAQEAEQRERWFQFKARLSELAVMTGLVVIAVLSGAGAFYILCASIALLRQQQQLAPRIRPRESRVVVPFPDLLQRAHAFAKNPVALVALVFVIAALTVGVAL